MPDVLALFDLVTVSAPFYHQSEPEATEGEV
jgi:hypothetical protein